MVPPAGVSRGDHGATSQTRVERKERTRRAIMTAALDLCEDSSLVALSLRQVEKEVGIVPPGSRDQDLVVPLPPAPHLGG